MRQHQIGIVAHTRRAERAHHLFDALGCVHLAMDDGTYGPGVNHHRCWSHLAERNPAPWSVVLEDDAEPVDGFIDQLGLALAAAPTQIVSLYLGHPDHWAGHYPQRRRDIETAATAADHRGACFITTRNLIHGVGVAIKTELVPSMLSYTSLSSSPYDYAIRNWARDNSLDIAFTWPSLIDHADLPTLIRHPDGRPRTERRAYRRGTRTHWDSSSVSLSKLKEEQ